jgi:hypothetical protein
MNTEEKRLLSEFLDQLKGIRGIQKDEEAQALIKVAADSQPDALYLLVQKSLLQDQALNGAKVQIAALQRELADVRRNEGAAGSFLGNNPWGAPAGRPAPVAAPQGYPQAAPVSGAMGASPFGSFLGSAAATAAGVAGGAFLFQGLESLMGHHGGGYGFSDTGYMGHGGAENVTINEYYGDSATPRTTDAAYLPDDGTDISAEDGWDSYDDNTDSIDV